MAASAAYADSFLVLAAELDEPWRPHWPARQMARHFVSNGGPIRRIAKEIFAGLWLARQRWRRRFDVLHTHQNTGLIVGVLWLLLTEAPLVFDSHDLFDTRPAGSRNLVRRIGNWIKWHILQKYVLTKATCALHVSPGFIEIYRREFPRGRHVLLWNIPSFSLSQPERKSPGVSAPPSSSGGTEPPPLRLAYFGLLTSSRISPWFVRLVTSVPNVHLTLHGRFYEHEDDAATYREELENVIAELSGEKVLWKGPYTNASVPAILEEADLLVFPMTQTNRNSIHALPNKFFETCAAGRGMIYSHILKDMDQLAIAYEFGAAFDPHDEPALRALLGKLAMDRAAVERMKENARRFFWEGSWSPAAYAAALETAYFPQAGAALPDSAN